MSGISIKPEELKIGDRVRVTNVIVGTITELDFDDEWIKLKGDRDTYSFPLLRGVKSYELLPPLKPMGSLWLDPENNAGYVVTDQGNDRGLVQFKEQDNRDRRTLPGIGSIAAHDSVVGNRLIPWPTSTHNAPEVSE